MQTKTLKNTERTQAKPNTAKELDRSKMNRDNANYENRIDAIENARDLTKKIRGRKIQNILCNSSPIVVWINREKKDPTKAETKNAHNDEQDKDETRAKREENKKKKRAHFIKKKLLETKATREWQKKKKKKKTWSRSEKRAETRKVNPFKRSKWHHYTMNDTKEKKYKTKEKNIAIHRSRKKKHKKKKENATTEIITDQRQNDKKINIYN